MATSNGEGDAAACSMCVQLVKNWMPGCPHWDGSPREPSLCDALGVTAGQPGTPLLPELFTNGVDASDARDRCVSANKDLLAQAYCTGWSDEPRRWCDARIISWDFKAEVPGYTYGTWLDEQVLVNEGCSEFGIDALTSWDGRLMADQAWLGRPYWGSVDVESPGLGRITPVYQHNDRGTPQARACGARQPNVVARDSCAALYSKAGLALPAGFPLPPEMIDKDGAGGAGPEETPQPYRDDTQDLFEIMAPIHDHLNRDVREPYCSARMPVGPTPRGCPDGMACQPDGFCRANTPGLVVLSK